MEPVTSQKIVRNANEFQKSLKEEKSSQFSYCIRVSLCKKKKSTIGVCVCICVCVVYTGSRGVMHRFHFIKLL